MNKYKLKYEVIHAMQLADFEEQVNEKIKEGWEPIGGVCVDSPHNLPITFLQAMILKGDSGMPLTPG